MQAMQCSVQWPMGTSYALIPAGSTPTQPPRSNSFPSALALRRRFSAPCFDRAAQTVPSDRAILCKQRHSLLQVRCQPLSHLQTGEPQHLQCGGGVEQRTVNPKPIVESILGPANGALGPVDEI